MEPEIVKTPLRQRMPGWSSVLLQILSFVLCLCLTGNLFGLMFTADLQQILDKEGFRTLVDTAFSSYFTQIQAPRQGRSAQPAAAVEEQGSLDFSSSDSIVDWAYSLIQKSLPGTANIQKESVRNFLAESTVKDHLAHKLSSSVSSLLETGTVEDLFTKEEIATLMEENQDLIAREFGVTLTPDVIAGMAGMMDETIQADGINGKFRSFVEGFAKGETPILFGITAQDILSFLARQLTSDAFWTQLITCLVLAVLLCAANFYNIPAGLTWTAFPCLISGGILALATGLMKLPGSLQSVSETIKALISPVHYTVLGIGAALLVISIAWRILRSAIAKKAPATA